MLTCRVDRPAKGRAAGFCPRRGTRTARGSALYPSAARLRAGVAVAALLTAGGAGAADLAATAAGPFDWSGFYLGGHIGMASAGSAFAATQPGGAPGFAGTVDLFRRYDFFTGEGSNIGGFQFGYNAIYRSGLMLGLEADITFPGFMSGLSTLATPSIGTATYERPAADVGIGARPHRLCLRPLALLRDRRLRLGSGSS